MAGRIPKVVVVGPAYVDVAIKCDEVPGKGETVKGSGFSCIPCGSGVNCSVQAALCGCETYFLGKVGDDIFGRVVLGALDEKGVVTEYSFKAPAIRTGGIVTMVDSAGENSSCVSQGANRALNVDEVGCATCEQLIGQADVCLICADVPEETVCGVIKLCKIYQTKIILETTLAARDVDEISSLDWPGEFFMADVLVPEFINTSIKDPGMGNSHDLKFVASELVARGIETVLIRMGNRGCFIVDKDGVCHVEGFDCELVDCEGSDDAFAGALAASCGCGDDIKDAVRFSEAAECLAAQRFGAIEALPSKEDIIELLQREG